MMQFLEGRKQEMRSSKRVEHYDVISCKQRHVIIKHYWCKDVSTCYNHRKFEKVSFINEGVIAFSIKVLVFLDTLYLLLVHTNYIRSDFWDAQKAKFIWQAKCTIIR